MRKSLRVSVLLLALCGSAFAGELSNPPIAPVDVPAPPSAAQSGDSTAVEQPEAEATADGIIHGEEVDGLTAAALSVLNSVLALF